MPLGDGDKHLPRGHVARQEPNLYGVLRCGECAEHLGFPPINERERFLLSILELYSFFGIAPYINCQSHFACG